MREIKFRAWDSYHQVLSYSYQYPNLSSFFDYVGRIDLGEGFELMQYTGLKDKNGVEIYEGDIVKIHWLEGGNGRPVRQISKVKWNGNGYGNVFESPSYYKIHVIGNIYENPELLEGV